MVFSSFDHPIRCTDPSHDGALPTVGWLSGTSESAYIQRDLPGTDSSGRVNLRAGTVGRQLNGSQLVPVDLGGLTDVVRDTRSVNAMFTEARRIREEHQATTTSTYRVKCDCGIHAEIRQQRLDRLAGTLLDFDYPTDDTGEMYVPLILLNS